jgi:hypothetical protein
MRKTINQFPYGEAHMHIFMNGTDYKKAVADQKNGVCDRVIHAHLAEYRKRGITWLREGGDIYGTSKRTMELAPAYGITYRTPIFAIHKKGHYGAIVGRGYETMQEYREIDRGSAPEGRTLRENYDLRHHGLYSWRSDGTFTCRQ